MMSVSIVERHAKNAWVLDVFSDGVILVFTDYKGSRVNQGHLLRTDDAIDSKSKLPKYVKQMVYDARDAHRNLYRLPLDYRIEGFAKRKRGATRVSLDFYMHCVNAGKYYINYPNGVSKS